MTADLEQRIATLASWMRAARHLVVFTGAGISTESGIRDYRGPDGVWTRRDKGLSTPERDIFAAEPNAGHRAIRALQEMAKLSFLISQNVDNLHLKSGIRPELLAELHGNATKVRCQGCGFLMDNFADQDVCPLCRGALVSSVVHFGQSLPQEEVAASFAHARQSDLFIVVGSSLVVFPAAQMPQAARESGARLVIINQGETPLDDEAHLRFREGISEVLPPAVTRLQRLLDGN